MNHLIAISAAECALAWLYNIPKVSFVDDTGGATRVQLHVVQRVVHPAQIPLVPEPQTAASGGRVTSEVRRLFRHADVSAPAANNALRYYAQKTSMASVFQHDRRTSFGIPALAAVVAVDYRGHRIDTRSASIPKRSIQYRALPTR